MRIRGDYREKKRSEIEATFLEARSRSDPSLTCGKGAQPFVIYRHPVLDCILMRVPQKYSQGAEPAMAVWEKLDFTREPVERRAQFDAGNSASGITTEQLLDELVGRFEDDDSPVSHLASMEQLCVDFAE